MELRLTGVERDCRKLLPSFTTPFSVHTLSLETIHNGVSIPPYWLIDKATVQLRLRETTSSDPAVHATQWPFTDNPADRKKWFANVVGIDDLQKVDPVLRITWRESWHVNLTDAQKDALLSDEVRLSRNQWLTSASKFIADGSDGLHLLQRLHIEPAADWSVPMELSAPNVWASLITI